MERKCPAARRPLLGVRESEIPSWSIERHGGTDGHYFHDWLQAEREIKGPQTNVPAARLPEMLG